MKTRSYTVLWSQGPHDNPTDGVFEIMATCMADAYEQVTKQCGVPVGDIDGIVLTEIWLDCGIGS